jgi:hypothetical protein
VCIKVKYPFWVTKRQFGHAMVRNLGLKKNTAQLIALLASSQAHDFVHSMTVYAGPLGLELL